MKIISVCAPCNGSGKTTLIRAILQAFPGQWNVLKCTTIYSEEQFCPIGDAGCACRHLEGNFCLIDDPARISQKETDTGIFVEAGARSVYWGISRPGHHLAFWKLFTSLYLDRQSLLLIEGNTLAAEVNPDLQLFVVDPLLPRDRYKANADELARRADYLIFNVRSRAPEQAVSTHVTETAPSRSRLRTLYEDINQPLHTWRNQTILQKMAELTWQREISYNSAP